MHDDPDTLLLAAVAEGSRDALESLYERHGLGLLRLLVTMLEDRALAEEALQNVMLAVWRGAKAFRGESLVTTWLFGIARRQALKMRRDLRRQSPPAVPLDESLAAAPDDSAHFDALETALDQLPPDQQEALDLIYYRGCTVAEAATLLHIPEGTLKSRLFRARATLRLLLAKETNHA
jgi:RNA polymerase sigma factor (sigma-70 family)